MSSNAVSGVGTRFRRWNTTTHKWADLAEVNQITGPSKTRATINVTSLDSTSGYEEFIAGFRNAGTVKLGMNFTRANYDLLNADFESNVLQNYEIVLSDPDQTALEFEGLVTELPLVISPTDKITCDISIQISGKVYSDLDSGGSSGLVP